MAFMGMLRVFSIKVSSIGTTPSNILLRKLPEKVLEKFQIFSELTADYAGFRLWGAQAAYVPMNAMII